MNEFPLEGGSDGGPGCHNLRLGVGRQNGPNLCIVEAMQPPLQSSGCMKAQFPAHRYLTHTVPSVSGNPSTWPEVMLAMSRGQSEASRPPPKGLDSEQPAGCTRSSATQFQARGGRGGHGQPAR